MSDFVIVANNTGYPLAEKVCKYIGIDIGELIITYHNDGEPIISIKDDLRDKDVFFIAPYYPEPLKRYAENILVCSAIKGAKAKRLIFVPTYLGFTRQHKKDEPRTSIYIAELARDLSCRCDHILFIDLHRPEIEGMFHSAGLYNTDKLSVFPLVFAKYIKEHGMYGENWVVLSPDVGGAERARKFAEMIDSAFGIGYKHRPEAGEIDEVALLGEIEGKNVIFVDDMIDTGGSIVSASELAKEKGAENIYVFAAHGIFSKKHGKKAEESLAKAPIEYIYITDTIPRTDEYLKKYPHIKIISISEILSDAILRIHEGRSISKMYEK